MMHGHMNIRYLQLVLKNQPGYKPTEETHLKSVPGRWPLRQHRNRDMMKKTRRFEVERVPVKKGTFFVKCV
jgi:hypothetical protein